MTHEPELVGHQALPSWLRPVAEAGSAIDSPRFLSPSMPEAPTDARPAAVLLLFGEGEAGPDVLLTERAHTLRSHAGQIAFPGGATDPTDAGPITTALREAEEEVGLDADGVDVFATLPRLWLPPSNFAVTPVLGWWRDPVPVGPVDTVEVASVFRTPLDHLMDPRNRFTVTHPSGFRGPGFDVAHGLTLWGFTAGVIARLLARAGWERPWDTERLRPYPQPRTDPVIEEMEADVARSQRRGDR
ncbi:NUDIX domain-containing protein [Mumia flava]|uniref:NUDIX domain-containing protein n=1 Tax=Mumia flava TaxID=1348852 RepID=A0A2M9BHH1_9ACTN|nr:CoA pyrophosphatase [Mumia flava]PJJ57392.1 NUDIX domain-containing protein [Mumia flava]